MNREIVWVGGLLLAVAAVLVGVNLVLWPPRDPTEPPPGYEIPNVPFGHAPAGGPGIPPAGGGGGPTAPPASNWYDLTDDRDAERTIQEAVARPAVAYGPSGPPTGAAAKEFDELFSRMLAAARKPGDAVKDHFDFRRYFEERIRQWAALRPGVPIPKQRRAAWGPSFHVAIDTRFFYWPDPKSLPDAARVVRAAVSQDGREAVVAVRYSEAGRGHPRVVRWRLVRGETGWKAFDFARPDKWLWFTASSTEPEKGTTSLHGTDDEEVGVLGQAVTSVGIMNPEYGAHIIDRNLASVRGKPLPPALVVWREYAEGQILLMRGKPAEAVPFLDAAVAADPLWPPAYAARAAAFNRLGKPDRALADALKAADLVGPWPEAVAEQVEALRKLGKPAEADAARRAALVLFPGDGRLTDRPAGK